MIKTYYLLTKPGIIIGNVITVIAGFLLASQGNFSWLLLATLLGLSSVIGSACVFNNYIDRHVDKKMERTKNRALANGLVSTRNAILFAVLLGLFGVLVLSVYTNLLTVFIALTGFIVYVVLYSTWKLRTMYGTLIGSVAGGVPPVVGYCAASNQFDLGAAILFTIVVLWQMPHFFAIAMYRFEDYARASIPVLPVKKGIQTTKVHMLLYIIAFIIAALLLTLCGYTGYIYFTVAALLGGIWLYLSIKGFKIDNNKLWARRMFLFSLVIITFLSLMISIDVT